MPGERGPERCWYAHEAEHSCRDVKIPNVGDPRVSSRLCAFSRDGNFQSGKVGEYQYRYRKLTTDYDRVVIKYMSKPAKLALIEKKNPFRASWVKWKFDVFN